MNYPIVLLDWVNKKKLEPASFSFFFFSVFMKKIKFNLSFIK